MILYIHFIYFFVLFTIKTLFAVFSVIVVSFKTFLIGFGAFLDIVLFKTLMVLKQVLQGKFNVHDSNLHYATIIADRFSFLEKLQKETFLLKNILVTYFLASLVFVVFYDLKFSTEFAADLLLGVPVFGKVFDGVLSFSTQWSHYSLALKSSTDAVSVLTQTVPCKDSSGGTHIIKIPLNEAHVLSLLASVDYPSLKLPTASEIYTLASSENRRVFANFLLSLYQKYPDVFNFWLRDKLVGPICVNVLKEFGLLGYEMFSTAYPFLKYLPESIGYVFIEFLQSKSLADLRYQEWLDIQAAETSATSGQKLYWHSYYFKFWYSYLGYFFLALAGFIFIYSVYLTREARKVEIDEEVEYLKNLDLTDKDGYIHLVRPRESMKPRNLSDLIFDFFGKNEWLEIRARVNGIMEDMYLQVITCPDMVYAQKYYAGKLSTIFQGFKPAQPEILQSVPNGFYSKISHIYKNLPRPFDWAYDVQDQSSFASLNLPGQVIFQDSDAKGRTLTFEQHQQVLAKQETSFGNMTFAQRPPGSGQVGTSMTFYDGLNPINQPDSIYLTVKVEYALYWEEMVYKYRWYALAFFFMGLFLHLITQLLWFFEEEYLLEYGVPPNSTRPAWHPGPKPKPKSSLETLYDQLWAQLLERFYPFFVDFESRLNSSTSHFEKIKDILFFILQKLIDNTFIPILIRTNSAEWFSFYGSVVSKLVLFSSSSVLQFVQNEYLLFNYLKLSDHSSVLVRSNNPAPVVVDSLNLIRPDLNSSTIVDILVSQSNLIASTQSVNYTDLIFIFEYIIKQFI